MNTQYTCWAGSDLHMTQLDMSVRGINNSLVLERQMLKKVFGLIRCDEGCRIRSNNEMHKFKKGEHIVE